MSERYRYLLRMPFELRDKVLDSAKANSRSFNAEVVDRLEQSFQPEREDAGRRARARRRIAHIPVLRGREASVSRKRMRLGVAALVVAVTVLGVAVGGRAVVDRGSPADYQLGAEAELPPLLAKKLANAARLAPPGALGGYQEGDRTAVDEEFSKRAYPGSDIPAAVLVNSKRDWSRFGGRGHEGSDDWRPIGPTNPKGLPQPLRDRSVYTAATPNFSGRIAHVAIDPNCGSGQRGKKDDCRLWIANANGGVWRTEDALDTTPQWEYLSRVFEHNNVASLELDPNDRGADTIWAGTGEPNACGSGCEAGVGLYRSTDGGDHWQGPFGRDAFYDRAAGSIAIRPGNSRVMFVASGRGIRGLSNVCCGGADAIIPGAPHFGLYRSLDGGASWQIVSQGAPTLCTDVSPDA